MLPITAKCEGSVSTKRRYIYRKTHGEVFFFSLSLGEVFSFFLCIKTIKCLSEAAKCLSLFVTLPSRTNFSIVVSTVNIKYMN